LERAEACLPRVGPARRSTVSLVIRVGTDRETQQTLDLTLAVERQGPWVLLRVDEARAQVPQDLVESVALLDPARDCHLTRVGFSASLGADSRRVLRALASYASFVHSDGPTWDATLTDPLGVYQARFHRPDAHHIQRRRLRYDRLLAGPGLSVSALDGTTTYEIHPDGWLAHITVRERTRIEMPGGALEGEVELDWEVGPDLADRSIAVPEDVTWEVPGEPLLEPAAELTPRRLPLPDGDAPALLRALALGINREALADRLAALIREDPGTIEALRLEVERPGSGGEGDLRPAIYYALGVAETPAAQGYLIEIATNRQASEFDRLHAIVALHGVVALQPEVVARTVALSRDEECLPCAGAAFMAVSSWAGRTEAPALAVRAFEEGLPRLIEEQPLVGLAAAGNHGGAPAVQWGREMLGAPRAEVRAAAADTLSVLPPNERWDAVGPLLTSEANPRVLIAVASVLTRGVREGAVPSDAQVAASLRLLVADDTEVRRAAIQWVGAESLQVPQARQALVRRFHEEPDAALRRTIGEHVTARELAAALPATHAASRSATAVGP
jgi:hypothetical protein